MLPLSAHGALAAGAAMVLVVSMPAAASSQEREDRPDPGETVTIAGNGESGYSGDGGDALDARLGERLEIDVGPDGEVYVADTDSGRVREITPEGTIDTVEQSSAGDSEDDCAPEVVEGWQWCPSDTPNAVASDDDGTLYIASNNAISTLDGEGKSTVIAGDGELKVDDDEGEDGGDGGPAMEAWIYEPADIEVDAEGNVYVVDPNNGRIRMIDPDGTISSVVGGGDTFLGEVDGEVAADDVKLSMLYGDASLAVDADGTLYFTVENVASVFRVDADGDLTTVVGTGSSGYSGDGGPAVDAEISQANAGLAVGSDGVLYVGDAEAERVRRVDPDGTISTVEGAFSELQDIALDSDDTLYTADSSQVSMHVMGEKVPDAGEAGTDRAEGGENPWTDLSPGEVATVAGTGDPSPEDTAEPVVPTELDEEVPDGFRGVAAADGNVYFTEQGRHDVRRFGPDGSVDTVAGVPDDPGFSGDSGSATAAQLRSPGGLAVDSDGTLVVADTGNNRIREISPDGTIETTAGNGESGDSDGWSSSGLKGDGGPATDAELAGPRGVAVDSDGARYIADPGNNQIHRVDGDGEIEAIAGNGERYFSGDGGPASEAQLYAPADVAVDGDGDVYLTDSYRHSVRGVDEDGTISTVAGSGDHTLETGGFSGDSGDAADSTLNTPTGLAAGPDGTVYVADTWNNRIRRIDSDGDIDTFAGSGAIGGAGDGGDATEAELGEPTSVAVTPDGGVLVADSGNSRIREVDDSGTIDTVADVEEPENGDDDTDGEPATDVDLGQMADVTTGSDNQVYIADQNTDGFLRMDAAERTISPMPVSPSDTDSQEAPVAGRVNAAAADGTGKLLVATTDGVRRVIPDGTVTPVAGGGTQELPVEDGATATAVMVAPLDIALDGEGGFYIATVDMGLHRVSADGTISAVDVGKPHLSGFDVTARIATDRAGNLYVADMTNSRVTRIAEDGTVTKVAGIGDSTVHNDNIGDGGPATEATVRSPSDVEVTDDGTLYLATMDGVRRVAPDGTIDTIVESDTTEDESTTTYHSPGALSLDRHGNLYFTVPDKNEVRVVAQVGQIPPSTSWTTLVFWVVVALAFAVATPSGHATAWWLWRRVPSPWADRLRRLVPARRAAVAGGGAPADEPAGAPGENG